MPGQVIYMEGGEELLDRIEPLWSELNKLHTECSADFSDFYKKMTFKAKKDFFSKKTRDGFLKVIIAQTDSAKEIGYCISTITREGRGEIESILVQEGFRGKGMDEELMTKSLKWLESKRCHGIKLAVAKGNEAYFRSIGGSA